jgi:hypothetical protein
MENKELQLSEKELKRLKKKARPFWKKKRFIIPAALIVLGIIGAATGGGSSSQPASTTSSTKSSSSKSSSDSSSSASTMYKVGQTFKVGEYEVKVNSVKKAKTISVMGGASTDKANGQYYIINVTLKNLSDTASTVDSSLFNLEHGGNKFSADSSATMDANMSSDGSSNNGMFLKQLNPGVTVTGNLVFDVPANLNKGVVLDVSGGFTSTDSAQVQLN